MAELLAAHKIWGAACRSERGTPSIPRCAQPRLSPGDHCHQRFSARGPSQRRGRAERLFPFSLLNLSGLILIHIGESVLSQLALVPGEKKNT